MSLNYISGHLLPALWTPTGFSTSSLAIRGYDLAFSTLLADVTTTASGGLRARLATLSDVEATLQMIFDLDSLAWNSPPLILNGVSGILSPLISTHSAIAIPVIIEKVHYVSQLENALLFDATFKANSRAGVLVYPSAA